MKLLVSTMLFSVTELLHVLLLVYTLNSLSPGPSRFPILKPQVIQEHALNSTTYACGVEYQSSVHAIEEDRDYLGSWKLLCKCTFQSIVSYIINTICCLAV